MTPENEAKKQYLLRYCQAEREIHLLQEELERLESMATRITPSYSGEVRGSGGGSRIESSAEKMDACRRKLDAAVCRALDIRQEIDEIIQAVPEWKLRELLTRRYILGQKWEQVAWEMNLDFRQVFRIHNHALSRIVIECHVPSVI